jgi:membrane-associated phospholipid phosphatase
MRLWLIHGFGTPLATLAFLRIALPREKPLEVLASVGRSLSRPGVSRLLILVLLLVAGVNFIESPIDPHVSAWLGYDMTRWVHSIEGDWVARLQSHVSAGSLLWLGLIYLPGWVALQLTAALVLAHRGQDRGLASYLLSFFFNYLFALPFYLFFPVKEVAWSGLSPAQPLLDQIWPGISEQIRFGSAVDNCFPSLHVSCAVTSLWFVQRHGPHALRLLAWVITLCVGWTVLALGIHWGLDVLIGIPYGLLCAWAGERLGGRVLARASPVPGRELLPEAIGQGPARLPAGD